MNQPFLMAPAEYCWYSRASSRPRLEIQREIIIYTLMVTSFVDKVKHALCQQPHQINKTQQPNKKYPIHRSPSCPRVMATTINNCIPKNSYNDLIEYEEKYNEWQGSGPLC
jgi:hypothetical protein